MSFDMLTSANTYGTIQKVEKTMPKTVGAVYDSVSITPTEEKSFYDAYCLFVFSDREVFYIRNSFSAG